MTAIDGSVLPGVARAANAASSWVQAKTLSNLRPAPNRNRKTGTSQGCRERTSGSKVGQSSRVSHLSLSGSRPANHLYSSKNANFGARNILTAKDL